MSNEQKAAGEANNVEPGKGGADERPVDPKAKAEAAHSGEAPASGETPSADSSAQSQVDAVLIENETLKAQIADLTGRLLRAHADMENLRKRSEREKQETAKYAISKFARDTVEVADNFARAIAAAPAEVAEQNDQFKALLEGVSMTERAFLAVLERHGVKQVSPMGEPFNPQLHQAVMQREDKSVAPGTVLEVFQAGYVIDDRCLRTAMVVVSTGGPKGKPSDKPAEKAAEKPAADEAPSANKTEDGAAAGSGATGEAPPEDQANGGGI